MLYLKTLGTSWWWDFKMVWLFRMNIPLKKDLLFGSHTSFPARLRFFIKPSNFWAVRCLCRMVLWREQGQECPVAWVVPCDPCDPRGGWVQLNRQWWKSGFAKEPSAAPGVPGLPHCYPSDQQWPWVSFRYFIDDEADGNTAWESLQFHKHDTSINKASSWIQGWKHRPQSWSRDPL